MAPPLAAPERGKVARACERVCGVPCNFRFARDRARQQNAAVDGAVLITQEEAARKMSLINALDILMKSCRF